MYCDPASMYSVYDIRRYYRRVNALHTMFNLYISVLLCLRWHYAKNSILCDIRRRRKMWSWSYIARHRINMKRYKDAYVKKLNVKKITDDLQEQIDVSRL